MQKIIIFALLCIASKDCMKASKRSLKIEMDVRNRNINRNRNKHRNTFTGTLQKSDLNFLDIWITRKASEKDGHSFFKVIKMGIPSQTFCNELYEIRVTTCKYSILTIQESQKVLKPKPAKVMKHFSELSTILFLKIIQIKVVF